MCPLRSRSSRESDAVDYVTINFLRALPSATEKTTACDEILIIALHDIEYRDRFRNRYQINFLFLQKVSREK